MSRALRILIVDDNESVGERLLEFLRKEGCDCHHASDARAADGLLATVEFDVLVADIQAAGGGDLEFVSRFMGIQDVPLILVTRFPSVETAASAVQLPIAAYLIKPVDPSSLLSQIRGAILPRQLRKAISGARERLPAWNEALKSLEESLRLSPRDKSGDPLETFLALTLQSIVHSLADLRLVLEAATRQMSREEIEQSFAKSRPLVLLDAVRETISVLEKTKSAFKSKELGDLRRKLEDLLSSTGAPPTARPALPPSTPAAGPKDRA